MAAPARLTATLMAVLCTATAMATATATAMAYPGGHAVAATPPPGPAWTVDGGDRPYLYAQGEPGAVLEDELQVTNPGARPLTVRLRPATTTATGGAAPGRPRGAAAWITLAAERVTVPPRTRAKVPFSITVPPATPPGDHPAAVTASAGGREASVRVHLRVSGPAVAALTVEDVSVSAGAVRYTLVNRGSTVLRPRVTITADGLFGEALRRTPRSLPAELPPARRVALTEKWTDPPVLDAVEVRVVASAEGPRRVRASGTASEVFVPWPPLAVLTGLSAVAAVALWSRRRRARPPVEGAC
ncbi:COG1470 family protein [Streptomyces jumonjinensis]|uniref:DUF916 domain-containing protein n=1 Tax=Streptomyces jumonjinensis TaxID=1945 RepID=A0A646KHN8_STRJU|nr:hypothetical protein [Streptomyces jumonjinensis]MQT01581.1 hypothetical protein [Streptomyces jumonjinensis]